VELGFREGRERERDVELLFSGSCLPSPTIWEVNLGGGRSRREIGKRRGGGV